MRPIFFSIGPIHIYGYGAMIVLGGIASFGLLRLRAQELGLKSDDQFWLMVNAIIGGGFIGGRVLFLFEYTHWFSRDFWMAILSPSSGFSVLGAFAGVPLGLALMCRAQDVPFWPLFDAICVMAPFWHIFGRLGCLLAGCCYGLPTAAPWGIIFRDPRAMVPASWLGRPLIATQLYEMAGNALIAACLYRFWQSRRSKSSGLVAAAYFAAYGIMRFFEEFYRGDTVAMSGLPLTGGQVLSLGLIVLAMVIVGGRNLCSRLS